MEKPTHEEGKTLKVRKCMTNYAFNHVKCKGHVKYEKTVILSRI
jgi:hypothetical protein